MRRLYDILLDKELNIGQAARASTAPGSCVFAKSATNRPSTSGIRSTTRMHNFAIASIVPSFGGNYQRTTFLELIVTQGRYFLWISTVLGVGKVEGKFVRSMSGSTGCP
jgi:hypothetical protein